MLTSSVALGREARRARNILRRVRVAGAHACDVRLGNVVKEVAVGGVAQPVGVVGEVVVPVGHHRVVAENAEQDHRACTHAHTRLYLRNQQLG
eukprot:COSAG01_NODE_801_length_13466_cov_585.329693_14_plen_93_part_00